MTAEPSPRPWQVVKMIGLDEDDVTVFVADARNSCIARMGAYDENDEANAQLIVDAVNNIDRLRDELDVERSQHCTDIEQAEYHAEHHRKRLEAERDHLRDLVRRLLPLAETAEKFADAESVTIKGICSLKGVDSSMVDSIRADIAALIHEAHAAIGEDKP